MQHGPAAFFITLLVKKCPSILNNTQGGNENLYDEIIQQYLMKLLILLGSYCLVILFIADQQCLWSFVY